MIVYNKSDYLFLEPIKPDLSCTVSNRQITRVVKYRIKRKKLLEQRIVENRDYLNELLSVVLNEGMLDVEVFETVLSNGGDEFVGAVVKPKQHKRVFKAQKQLIKRYKKTEVKSK